MSLLVLQTIHIKIKAEEIHEALQKIYSVYMPGSLGPIEYSEEDAKNRANIAQVWIC